MLEPRESKLFIKSRFARRGIYWLPNLFTIMALCAGFYAIVQAMGGRYSQAAMAIFAALRLARFNTNIEVVDKRFFQGLPSPAAACLVAGLVWAMEQYEVRGPDVRWIAWGLTMFAGLSMVSNFPFYS